MHPSTHTNDQYANAYAEATNEQLRRYRFVHNRRIWNARGPGARVNLSQQSTPSAGAGPNNPNTQPTSSTAGGFVEPSGGGGPTPPWGGGRNGGPSTGPSSTTGAGIEPSGGGGPTPPWGGGRNGGPSTGPSSTTGAGIEPSGGVTKTSFSGAFEEVGGPGGIAVPILAPINTTQATYTAGGGVVSGIPSGGVAGINAQQRTSAMVHVVVGVLAIAATFAAIAAFPRAFGIRR